MIPATGWLQVNIAPGALFDPGPTGLALYSQTVELTLPGPLPAGDLQSILLVR